MTAKSRLPYQNARIKRIRDAWISANGPCRNCGSSEELQVDHIDRASKDPDLRYGRRIWTLDVERRAIELAKCQVLCTPCHKAKSREEERVAECPKGHAMTPDNWYVRPGKPNVRKCRRCEYDITNQYKRAARARAKAIKNIGSAPTFVEFS